MVKCVGVGESKEERGEETVHVITIQVPEFIAVANERKRVEKGAIIATYFNALTPI